MTSGAPLGMHRCHDYPFLVRRWRAVAQAASLRLRRLTLAGKWNVFFLQSPALRETGGIYLSAGIHGDEAASPEALITWAERNVAQLRSLPLLLFPCLNPWGLVNNSRFDETGADLNRLFHREDLPLIHGIKTVVGARRFAAALTLHEDYDGEGLYIYEVRGSAPFWGEALLDVARPLIPIEDRTRVDGRKALAGIIRRRINGKLFARIGTPEAIWLQRNHSARTFTIETPSEFALHQRVAAQVAIIDECVRRVQAGDHRQPATVA